ncbi:hypothetical protein L3X38_024611 [Prunus dulcis]|uniref:Uncharacterized protein n=1 Tax=Prunus dulcis TaxID=3755 RepID=A0AAD4Z777_PRUDU|nr:hypothetical protein L3X38_024611 [Prunus dulcis]
MAEMYPELVEKVVVVSCGVGMTEEQKREQINKVGSNALNLLVPESAHDLRLLVNLTMHKPGPSKRVLDIFLHGFINATWARAHGSLVAISAHGRES